MNSRISTIGLSDKAKAKLSRKLQSQGYGIVGYDSHDGHLSPALIVRAKYDASQNLFWRV
jgi:hypothetical protein